MRWNEIQYDPDYEPDAPETLASMLDAWSDGYNADDVWSGERLAFDRKIIAAAQGLNHHVGGVLYRGQGISDESFDALAAGETITTDATQTLLTSWTKSLKTAQRFAEVSHENHGFSAIVIAIPASKLTVVVDFDQVEGLSGNAEREVLCAHESLTLTPDNIKGAIRYQGDD
jgi:hypothetical protein